ncbi:hypothetical protein B0O95_10565 [Mycetohabitans endofungorum]|uniref:Uncharacterized protein n=1 Tax=Mycetohabitans endofungorum TaxID=417203 RepID=A0A2P5KAY7_9BURK|nr:hypothetical protein B0O95_10565 [Mycetohabitans endofungorum]
MTVTNSAPGPCDGISPLESKATCKLRTRRDKARWSTLSDKLIEVAAL